VLIHMLGLPFSDLRAAYWSMIFSLTGKPEIPSKDLVQVQAERRVMEERLGTNRTSDAVQWLYGELNTLDTKANSILQLNAIGIAVVIFLVQPLASQVSSSPSFKTVAIVALVLLAWSVVTLSSINLVFWSRTKTLTGVETESTTEPRSDRVNVLIHLSDARSHVLRSSAVRAVIAFLALAGLVVAVVVVGHGA
jgi:hypothetical protein